MIFLRHAKERWQQRAQLLGLNDSMDALGTTFAKAMPEKMKNKKTRWELFKRRALHGIARYLIADGWRFAVVGNKCLNVERVKPHENFHSPRKLNGINREIDYCEGCSKLGENSCMGLRDGCWE